MSIKGTVLITGGSTGIGYELAKVFAANGYDLVLVARSEQKLRENANDLTSRYGIKVETIPADLAQLGGVEQLCEDIQTRNIRVDILVNNAGTGTYGLFNQTDILKQMQMINLNVVALTYLTRRFAERMLGGGGKILNVASAAAFQPIPNMAVYAATKAYVVSLTEALANEFQGGGVQISVLCPGFTKTPLTQKLAEASRSRVFLKNMMDPQAVAQAAYAGLMNNKTVIIPGVPYRFLAIAGRFAPRRQLAVMARKMVERRG